MKRKEYTIRGLFARTKNEYHLGMYNYSTNFYGLV